MEREQALKSEMMQILRMVMDDRPHVLQSKLDMYEQEDLLLHKILALSELADFIKMEPNLFELQFEEMDLELELKNVMIIIL